MAMAPSTMNSLTLIDRARERNRLLHADMGGNIDDCVHERMLLAADREGDRAVGLCVALSVSIFSAVSMIWNVVFGGIGVVPFS